MKAKKATTSDGVESDLSSGSEGERDSNTFKAFIIRFLYYQREQSIVNQVQKMTSIEQVRSAFRPRASDQNLLQFHHIENLSSVRGAGGGNFPHQSRHHEGFAIHDELERQADLCNEVYVGGSVISSKFQPEKCARNSYGQFTRRNHGALPPPPIDLTANEVTI